DLIRPDNNDGFNIKLSTSKENLSKELSNFLSVFKINTMMKEVLNTMKIILCSLGLKQNQVDFSSLIRQSIHLLKKDINYDILLEEINNNFEILAEEEFDLLAKEELDLSELDFNQSSNLNELLTKHQQ
ncbi:4270_t:CDS:2, partial [Cetraspora pellucida]